MSSPFTLQNDRIGKQAVFDIFSDYLGAETPTTAVQAANAVSKLVPRPADDSKTLEDGFFFAFWKDIFEVAGQIPHDHPAMDKLVKFMRELTLLNDTGLKVWETRVWTDLPIFGAAVREHLNGPGSSKQAEEQARIDRQWVRFHGFLAKLIGAGVFAHSAEVVWMLREALETDTGAKASAALDRDLATAAVYIEYAGPILAESVVRMPNPSLSPEDERALRGGPLYGGKPGLQADRWFFWLRRFRDEADKATADEVRQLASRSSRLMEIWVERRLQPKN